MSTNVSIETIRHEETDNGGPSQATNSTEEIGQRYADITKAVVLQLEKSKAGILKEVNESAEKQIEAAVKRALEEQTSATEANKKKKKEPEFKSKGNKIRYEKNEEILEKMDAAVRSIEKKDLEAAKKYIGEGKNIVTKDQKLICIADREENGWEVVRHYLSDDLASDSDDEKAINKARRDALATIKKRQKKRETFRNVRQNQHYKRDYGNRQEQKRYNYRDHYTRNQTYEKKSSGCYGCGDRGHWQYQCPLRYERR